MRTEVVLTLLAGVCLACQAETVKERVTAAFDGLSKECRDGITKKSDCEQTNKIQNLTKNRGHVCDKIKKQSVHKTCMLNHAGCEQEEFDAFRDRLCDFTLYKKIRGSKGLQIKFSTKCQLHFNECKNQRDTHSLLDAEDFCTAYKEGGNHEKCFETKTECQDDEDQDNFKNIRDIACSGGARLVAAVTSLVLVLMCLLL